MKNMIDLGRCDCRWPIDTAEGIVFCAAVIDKGSYCKEHRAVALRPTRFLTDRSYRKSYDHVRSGTLNHTNVESVLNPPVDLFVKNFGKPSSNRAVDYSVFLKESA